MSERVLFVATVVKTHIMHFHIPYLKMFKELGWRTTVVARNDYADQSECKIPYCDEYIDIAFERSPLKVANIAAYQKLKRLIKEQDFDIIHCHTPVAAVLTRLAARKARKRGTKVIYTAHGFHFFKGAPLLNWLVYLPVEWLCSFMTDTLITINQEDFTRAKKCMHAQRIEYIPGVGIDFSRFENVRVDRAAKRREIGVPEDAFLLLSVGELNENKNHQIIIKALAKLGDPQIHYAIAGMGEKRESLSELAKELGVSDRVHLLGYRKDIPELNYSADVFCFPSYREGLGLAAIEAMACGLPILTSNIHGINDYSVSGVTGYKYAPEDVEGFMDGIRKCVRNDVDVSVVSAENRKRAKQYEVSRSLERIREIYALRQ